MFYREVLALAAKRAADMVMVHDHKMSKAKACKIVGFSRSAFYKSKVGWAKDAPVINSLNEIITNRDRWGFWKCYSRLRHGGHVWSHKRVHRVYILR
jgi:putative transposase